MINSFYYKLKYGIHEKNYHYLDHSHILLNTEVKDQGLFHTCSEQNPVAFVS